MRHLLLLFFFVGYLQANNFRNSISIEKLNIL